MAADETRVDAADVLARVLAEVDVGWPCGDQRPWLETPEGAASLGLAALREAAGSGWVCIAPTGRLYSVRNLAALARAVTPVRPSDG